MLPLADGTGAKKVRVFDLSAMKAETDVVTPKNGVFGSYALEGPSANPRFYSALDPTRHRIYYADSAVGAPTCAPPASALDPDTQQNKLLWLDTSTLQWFSLQLPCFPDGFGSVVTGIFPDSASPHYLYLAGHDAVHEDQGTPEQDYMFALNPETGAIVSQIALNVACSAYDGPKRWPFHNGALWRYGASLYGACMLVPPGGNNYGSDALLKARLNPDGTFAKGPTGPAGQNGPVTTTIPALQNTGVQADPASGQALVWSNDSANYGFAAFAYSLTTDTFVGAIASGGTDPSFALTAAGYNPVLGRVYIRTVHALVTGDVRHRPLPGGTTYAALADPYTTPNRSALLIAVDPTTSTLYIPDRTSQSFLVYRDTAPPTPEAAPADPDAGTANIDEVPGKTAVNYAGAGNGYGARFELLGGPNTQYANRDPFCQADVLGLGQGDAFRQCLGDVATTPGDRSLIFSPVGLPDIGSVAFSPQEANADAQPAFIDRYTQADLRGNTLTGSFGRVWTAQTGQPPPDPCNPPPGQQPPSGCQLLPTPYDAISASKATAPSHCNDTGGAKQAITSGNTPYAASATCSLEGGVEASSSTGPGGAPPIVLGSDTTLPTIVSVSIGGSATKVITSRDPAKGLVTAATAKADNVTIFVDGVPQVLIGTVTTTADAYAHGRSGSASATFTRSFANVSAPTYQCTNDCKEAEVRKAIQAVFTQANINAQVYTPNPDATYVSGTPKGYQAVVSKDEALFLSDFSINHDRMDAAPALEIVIDNDGRAGPSREVVEFAGVHAESHFGVFPLPSVAGSATGTTSSGPSGLRSAVLPSVSADAGSAPKWIPGTAGGITAQPHGGVKTAPAVSVNGLGDVPALFRNGWQFLVNNPARAGLLAALWTLLLAPLYLAGRRGRLRGVLRTFA
ncbi:MAG: hypothetical protein E6J14_14285 [Chloroflexi bacterium]|nr:MAG: hypothetical protein E6J14_14285 [Chloroflexota bacterium]